MRRYEVKFESISPLNTNYDPPRPWTCQTPAVHKCDGHVTGKVGAYPVCHQGAGAEIDRRHAEYDRQERWEAENADLIAREAVWEQAMERRYS